MTTPKPVATTKAHGSNESRQSNPFQSIQHYMQEQDVQSLGKQSPNVVTPKPRTMTLGVSGQNTVSPLGQNPFFSEANVYHEPSTFTLFWHLLSDVMQWCFQRLSAGLPWVQHPVKGLDFAQSVPIGSEGSHTHKLLVGAKLPSPFTLPKQATQGPVEQGTAQQQCEAVAQLMSQAWQTEAPPTLQENTPIPYFTPLQRVSEPEVASNAVATQPIQTEPTALPAFQVAPTAQGAYSIDSIQPFSQPMGAKTSVTAHSTLESPMELTHPEVLKEEHIHARSHFVRNSINALVDSYFASKDDTSSV